MKWRGMLGHPPPFPALQIWQEIFNGSRKHQWNAQRSCFQSYVDHSKISSVPFLYIFKVNSFKTKSLETTEVKYICIHADFAPSYQLFCLRLLDIVATGPVPGKRFSRLFHASERVDPGDSTLVANNLVSCSCESDHQLLPMCVLYTISLSLSLIKFRSPCSLSLDPRFPLLKATLAEGALALSMIR